jgi:phosphoglycerol transferase MdoB-like AlkP superfamily enzyme
LKRFFTHPWIRIPAGIFAWTLLVYAILEAGSNLFFDVEVLPRFWIRDFLAHLLLSSVIYLMARNFRTYAIAYALVVTILHVSNALKMVILGSPMMPDDFISVRNMFMLFSGWKFWIMVLMLAVPLTALAAMIHWRHPRSWLSLSLVGAGILVLLNWPAQMMAAMDRQFGDWIWNQPGNYRERGLLIHLVQETARNISRGLDVPDEAAVTKALQTLGHSGAEAQQASNNFTKRNVHIILLESFWDPLLLEGIDFSGDPLSSEFRELWAQTGNSTVLSPVFGGYTANAEFEALCGFPVTVDTVFFEGWVRKTAPCLPAHLRAQGYHTYTSHPNVAAFWNRVNVYDRIGFDTYWSKKDFVLDDMNRNFLGDASLYRQMLEKLDSKLQSGEPILDYIVTIFGHLDYPFNASRPKVIQASGDNRMLEDYANQIYYKSRELMVFLEELRKRDPDGLIVIFGDHLPFLGPNYGGYTEIGMLESSRDKFTDPMFRTLTRTPMIVIDGRKGPVNTGELPMYRIPELVLDLLGDKSDSILRLSRLPIDQIVRPLPGLHLLVEDEKSSVCKQQETDSPAVCSRTEPLVEALDILTYDLFNGEQHGLKLMEKRGG